MRHVRAGLAQDFFALVVIRPVGAGVELPHFGFIKDVGEASVPCDVAARVGGGEEFIPIRGHDVRGIIYGATFGSLPIGVGHVAAVGVVGICCTSIVGLAWHGGVEHNEFADAGVEVVNHAGHEHVAKAVRDDGGVGTEQVRVSGETVFNQVRGDEGTDDVVGVNNGSERPAPCQVARPTHADVMGVVAGLVQVFEDLGVAGGSFLFIPVQAVNPDDGFFRNVGAKVIVREVGGCGEVGVPISKFSGAGGV